MGSGRLNSVVGKLEVGNFKKKISATGEPCRSRTYDQEIKSLLLYQLS